MKHFGRANDILFGENKDVDGDIEIWICGEHSYLNKESAVELIAHLKEVFEIK